MAISMGVQTLLLAGSALLVFTDATAQQPARSFSEKYLSLTRDLTERFQRPLLELSIREIIELFSLLEQFDQIVWREGRLEGIRSWERIKPSAPDVLQNGIGRLVDGTRSEGVRRIMEARANTLLHGQEVKYRMIAAGIESIGADYHPVIIEALLAHYFGGRGNSHRYADPEGRSVAILEEQLRRTPLSQLHFPALAEVFYDLSFHGRRGGRETLEELAFLVRNDPLLLGSFYLDMPPDQSQQVLEERMNELLWEQGLRYRMAIEGLLAVFSIPDSSGASRPAGWLSVEHRLWWFYLREQYATLVFRIGLGLLVLSLIGTTGYALRKRRDLRRAERALMRELEEELQKAHQLQMGLMPVESPQISGFDLAGRCMPHSHVGGDFFQYFQRKGKFSLCMADVTGHAMEAAIPVVMFSGVLKSQMELSETMETLFDRLNRTMHGSLDSRTYVCFAMGELDVADRSFRLANSGCPYPFHFRAAACEVEEIQVDAYPLGVRAETAYTALETDLQAGDYVVFCSDGIIEIENIAGNIFGFEQTAETIRSGCAEGLSAEALIDRLLGTVRDFAGETPQGDDMTCVVIRVE